MTTVLELHETMAMKLADDVLNTQVLPRAGWVLRQPVVPGCGHEPTWFDWSHPIVGDMRVMCDPCFSKHLGSADGDVH